MMSHSKLAEFESDLYFVSIKPFWHCIATCSYLNRHYYWSSWSTVDFQSQLLGYLCDSRPWGR